MFSAQAVVSELKSSFHEYARIAGRFKPSSPATIKLTPLPSREIEPLDRHWSFDPNEPKRDQCDARVAQYPADRASCKANTCQNCREGQGIAIDRRACEVASLHDLPTGKRKRFNAEQAYC